MKSGPSSSSGEPAQPLDSLVIDDLSPLTTVVKRTTARPHRRIRSVHRLDDLDAPLEHKRFELERETGKHARQLERAAQRHEHLLAVQQRRTEAWVLLAVLLLLLGSGISWLVGWGNSDASQIVFTTTFGGLAGYIGGQRRAPRKPAPTSTP